MADVRAIEGLWTRPVSMPWEGLHSQAAFQQRRQSGATTALTFSEPTQRKVARRAKR